MVWIVKADYEGPSVAINEARDLQRERPELSNYIQTQGSSIIVRNSTKRKGLQVKEWIKEFTIPQNVQLLKEKPKKSKEEMSEVTGKVNRAREIFNKVGSSLENVGRGGIRGSDGKEYNSSSELINQVSKELKNNRGNNGRTYKVYAFYPAIPKTEAQKSPKMSVDTAVGVLLRNNVPKDVFDIKMAGQPDSESKDVLVVRNSTKRKAEEVKKWLREGTSPEKITMEVE